MEIMSHRLKLSLLGWAVAALFIPDVLAAGNAAVPSDQSSTALGATGFIQPVTRRDHILGNPDAPLKIVEFADTECPLCKRFHPTLQRIVTEYPGKVAWVFRHFPLDNIHPKARREAEATECANELGGNEKFWTYLDRLYEITPSNNQLDPAELPRIAEYVGLNGAKFEQCLQSGQYAQRVAENFADALAANAQGTPYSIVIAENGRMFAILGAQPYATMKLVIDIALQQKK